MRARLNYRRRLRGAPSYVLQEKERSKARPTGGRGRAQSKAHAKA
jgi:hypothetical protein